MEISILTAAAARWAPFILVAYFAAICLEMSIQGLLKKSLYDMDDTINNLITFFVNRMAGGIGGAFFFATLSYCSPFAFWHFSGMPGIILTFVLVDFLYYFQHWCFHSFAFLAPFHDVHHTSDKYNYSTALRACILLPFVNPIFYVPAVLIGAEPVTVIVCFTAIQVYQFFLHSELIPSLGIFEGFLNTASAHRVHHGNKPRQFTKNLGGVLMLWDKIFSTYTAENEKLKYGIKGMSVEHNFFVSQVQPFVHFAKRLQAGNSNTANGVRLPKWQLVCCKVLK